MPLPNAPLVPGLNVLDRVASQWKKATGVSDQRAVQQAKRVATRSPQRRSSMTAHPAGSFYQPQKSAPFLQQLMKQSGVSSTYQPRGATAFGGMRSLGSKRGFGQTGTNLRDFAVNQTKLNSLFSLGGSTPSASTPTGDASMASSGVEGVRSWDSVLQKVSQESDVPYAVLASIMAIESGGANLQANEAGATGLMQVVPEWWQDTANKYGGDLQNPYTNVRTAAEILSGYYQQYGSWDLAAAAYNGGPKAVQNGQVVNYTDSYNGNTVQNYVDTFRNNLSYFGYGGGSGAEQASGGAAASNYAYGAVQSAASAIGAPYVWGGESWEEGGFDCSGLVQWAYGQNGRNPGRTAAEQYQNTARIDASQLQPGDLVFYSDGGGITHVAIYAGNGEIIDAPSEGKTIRRISMNTQWYADHTVGYGRVM